MRIVLASATVAQYPNGGGHWNWFLQYPLGLRGLGHDVLWLEVMRRTDDRARDLACVRTFLERTTAYGLQGHATIALVPDTPVGDLDGAELYGATSAVNYDFVRGTDLLWNFWYGLKAPLLDQFKCRAFIDVDPGHLQVCAATFPRLAIGEHDHYFTVGLKVHDPDCGIPTLGHKWRGFRPFVYLPGCQFSGDPGASAPITSITHWTWEYLEFGGRQLSVSKRDAYLRYLTLPTQVSSSFELAADLPPDDEKLFRANRWNLASPAEVARSPAEYSEYIERSRAEFVCPKPIHIDLKTGWFSDRSVVYLASGRPVLVEDTGLSEKLPVGRGLLTFRDLAEAVAATAEIEGNYAQHRRAARDLAVDLFDSRKCLNEMLSACGF